jgi:hypothetical protein
MAQDKKDGVKIIVVCFPLPFLPLSLLLSFFLFGFIALVGSIDQC